MKTFHESKLDRVICIWSSYYKVHIKRFFDFFNFLLIIKRFQALTFKLERPIWGIQIFESPIFSRSNFLKLKLERKFFWGNAAGVWDVNEHRQIGNRRTDKLTVNSKKSQQEIQQKTSRSASKSSYWVLAFEKIKRTARWFGVLSCSGTALVHEVLIMWQLMIPNTMWNYIDLEKI